MFFFVCWINEVTVVIYDIIFYNKEVIVYNNMWLFGIYAKDVIIIEDPIIDIVIELKKQFKQSIDNADPIVESEIIMNELFNRWGLKN